MDNIPIDFCLQENVTLDYLETGMRQVECEIKLFFALLAISLGRIYLEKLYLKVAPDWKAYLRQERTDLKYPNAVQLTKAGAMFWKYRQQLEEKGIQFRQHRSKMALVDPEIADHDPMFWDRFKTLSVNGLKDYIKRKRDDINVYTGESPVRDHSGGVTVSGTSLAIDGIKVRGINLNQARQEIAKGRRAVVFWVENDNEARKMRRHFNKQ